MKKQYYIIFCAIFLISFSCANINDSITELEEDIRIDELSDDQNSNPKNFKILSLGDSYTIGERVCDACKFPEQLKDSLSKKFETDTTFTLKVIAKTGWTTSSLMSAIVNENISNDYHLVTLLIGVNNQYQGKNFSIYENEFPKLIATATKAVDNDKNKLIVISIPDYAFTPFGNGNTNISEEIDKYNLFAKKYCEQNEITFVNITDITRNGLTNPDLVASDGLHPSKLAYTKFVERLLPFAIEKLKN
ncbi:SGNH/GDSL hydrolase family protein [uncultured Polaribacter sp.]|uniref:SGNH/GDSL hydrolase family protein n=1 Tax=uncultured Polaribacter sp. TaxID=174711 RepID=UPI002607A41F|nr:SGNH/GDSL hydrolase family protein [uncultured Polaribacter sp.]